MTRTPIPVLLLLVLLALTGCVQVEEDLALTADGSGTYDLVLAWDAALLDEAVSLVGPEVAARFRGRDLPLTIEGWRDGLRDVEGVTIRTLTLRDEKSGRDEDGPLRRTLRLQLRFRHLRDLLGWELFARRGLSIRSVEVADGPPVAALVTSPLARVPFLDPLAAALAARRAPPPEGAAGSRELDPPPLERLGIPPLRVEEVERLLRPRLREVRLRFRIRPPGDLVQVGPDGEATRYGALFVRDFDDLAKGLERGLRLRWAPRPLDPIPELAHEGDRAATAGGAR